MNTAGVPKTDPPFPYPDKTPRPRTTRS